MRVLVLTNLYPPNAMGGYELSCRDVVDRWRGAGHDLQVLTTSGRVGGTVEPAADEPHVHRDLEWWWHEHRFVRPSWRARARLVRRDLDALRARLDASRPDVVSVWHMGGLPLALLDALSSYRVVLNICDEWPVYASKVDAWLDGCARMPSAVRRATAVLTGLPVTAPDLDAWPAAVVSRATLEEIRTRSSSRLPHATVVGSGIDERDFPPATGEPKEWSWKLLGVGRIEPRKGFASAVAALAELPEQTTLRLVGVPDPEHVPAVTHPRVQLGALPRHQLAAAYRQHDALVFPSRWREPFGLVPLEGMSQGIPVVATALGGSAEFLEDRQNCLVVPPDDPVALAAAVRELAADPGLRARLVAGGRETAARWTVSALAARLSEVHGL